MNRRGFLLGCIAAGAAPAIVRAESLMKLTLPNQIYVGDWVTTEFGLALPKREGAVLMYDAYADALWLQDGRRLGLTDKTVGPYRDVKTGYECIDHVISEGAEWHTVIIQ